MNKMKTQRSAAKRFSLTKKGKIKRSKAYHSHLLTSKNTKRKRGLRKATYISPSDEGRVRRMLGL